MHPNDPTMNETAITPISQVPDGTLARLRGEVRVFDGQTLVSPLGGRTCVYHEVRDPVVSAPLETRGQSFLLEDRTGRALVVLERQQVDVRPRLRQELVSLLDANVQAVSAHLHRLKERYHSAAGPEASRISRELNRKKKVATLLCALRAQARDRVHMGKDLQDQAARIARLRSQIDTDEELQDAEPIPVERYEVTLEEGEEVMVEGFCQWEPDPDPSAHGASYRERPLRLVVHAPADGELRVEGGAHRAMPSPDRSPESVVARVVPGPGDEVPRPLAPRERGNALPWIGAILALSAAASALIYC